MTKRTPMLIIAKNLLVFFPPGGDKKLGEG